MADIGTGATVTFATNAFAAQITKATPTAIKRDSFPTSHLGTTGGMTFMPGRLYDPGELDMDILYNASTRPSFTATAETITIVYPNGASTNSMAGSGYVTEFVPGNLDVEGLQMSKVKVKFSGSLTFV